MKRCAYISSVIDKNCINKFFKDKFEYMPHQSQKYNKLLMLGLEENEFEVTSLSIIPLNRKVSKKIFIKNDSVVENKINYKYLKFINLIFLRQISVIINTFLVLVGYRKKNKDSIIFIDLLGTSSLIGLFLFKLLFKTKVIGILTDIPGFKSSKKQEDLKITLTYKILYSKINYFIAITEDMKNIIESLNKKAMVIEGLTDLSFSEKEEGVEKYSKFTCFYAGTLAKIYGVGNLVNAFTDKRLKEVDLIIYGNGDCKEEIKELESEYSNIKYQGSASNEVIIKEQKKCSLLINPRPTDGLYTKYSFPSKIIEYMTSGVSVAATNLKGIPDEYKKYLILIQDYSSNGIADLVYDIYKNGIEDKNLQGKAGRDFVLKEKNNIIQIKKLINILKNENILK